MISIQVKAPKRTSTTDFYSDADAEETPAPVRQAPAPAGSGVAVAAEAEAEAVAAAEEEAPATPKQPDDPAQAANTKDPSIPVSGFLIDVGCPTEERLTLCLDVTTLAQHLDFASGLVERVDALNQQYSKTARPRSYRVRYAKEYDENGAERYHKILEFSPYPSPFINTLKETRSRMYQALDRHCLILGSEKFGVYKRNIYFLPAAKSGDLVAEVNTINSSLKSLQDKIRAFESAPETREITEYIATHLQPITLRAEIGFASVNPVPFSLDRNFILNFVEEAKAEIDEEKKKGLQAMETELENRRIQMIKELEESFRAKVLNALEQLESAMKADKTTHTLINSIESATSLAASLQLSIAKPLRELTDALKGKEKPSVAASRLAISIGRHDASMTRLKEQLKSEPFLFTVRAVEQSGRGER